MTKIEHVVAVKQRLDTVFTEKELPHSFMIAQYALKQLIYELQKREESDTSPRSSI